MGRGRLRFSRSGKFRRAETNLRKTIDLKGAPEELFCNPWQDEGIALLEPPAFQWKACAPGRIHGFAASAHEEIDKRITTLVSRARKERRFVQAVEWNIALAHVEGAQFRKSYKTVGERFVLSGASATRLLNRYRWANPEDDPAGTLARYFEDCRARNADRDLPVLDRRISPTVPFAIECRNSFNYFHFLTEALPQLTVLDGWDFRGDIYFHFPNRADKTRDFAAAFVAALFPEFEGRVRFEPVPKDYDEVLTAYDLFGGHRQSPEWQADALKEAAGPRSGWEPDDPLPRAQTTLAMNSVSSGLRALRDRALKAVAELDTSHLPRRFFVGRDTRKSRARNMEGEDLLFEHLALFGFEYIVFESLSPLEQIALMANAEMMVSYHGAGFANMVFANPEACIIELGTLQTANLRWGDFWPHAHVSGCRYVSFFADYRKDDPLTDPEFSKDGLVPAALSEGAIGQVMAFVVSMLGETPTLAEPQEVIRLCRALQEVDAMDAFAAVLAAHEKMQEFDPDLSLLQADLHKFRKNPKEELSALDRAFRLAPSRWQVLVRMIWCANRCERPQVIRWALSRLAADFPDRHAAFIASHEWVRYVA
ncbi:MAG: hypothetical protein CML61_10265 [Rhodobacteraceae bacterium]|nr:hypothetical protein [Paracoccaceae bacterium]